MHDEYNIPPMYFGNDAQQTRVIELLEKRALGHKEGMHLVCGGPASGKSKALQLLREQLECSPAFTHMAHADDIAHGHIPADIPPGLGQLLAKMNEGAGVYIQHDVFKASGAGKSGKDFYVVVADGESPLTDRNVQPLLNEAAELIKDKNKGYELLWVADVPVRLQATAIFAPSAPARHEMERHNAAAAELERAHDKIIARHTLKYDVNETRDAIWKAVQEQGAKVIEGLKETTHRPGSESDKAYWSKACEAALAGNHKAYNDAMRVLAVNARTGPALGSAVSA